VIAQTTVQPTVGRIDLDWKPMQVGKSAAIVPITQDEAIRILEVAPYPNQRKVDEPTIVILQRYLTTGRFRISTIHLMYCLATETWYLVNGQHRMWALRRAGVTTEFDVISEVVETFADVEAAYTSHDRGRTRSATQLINALASVGDDLNRSLGRCRWRRCPRTSRHCPGLAARSATVPALQAVGGLLERGHGEAPRAAHVQSPDDGADLDLRDAV
jgi:hypothetical protein